jgi:hypothetical protein
MFDNVSTLIGIAAVVQFIAQCPPKTRAASEIERSRDRERKREKREEREKRESEEGKRESCKQDSLALID